MLCQEQLHASMLHAWHHHKLLSFHRQLQGSHDPQGQWAAPAAYCCSRRADRSERVWGFETTTFPLQKLEELKKKKIAKMLIFAYHYDPLGFPQCAGGPCTASSVTCSALGCSHSSFWGQPLLFSTVEPGKQIGEQQDGWVLYICSSLSTEELRTTLGTELGICPCQ